MLGWVDWPNYRRLLDPIENIPLAEAAATVCAALATEDIAASLIVISLRQAKRGSVFLHATTRSFSHVLDHLWTLRHELARLFIMTSAAHGRSHLVDLIIHLKAQAVASSAMVMDHLGVTHRTALSLIGKLVDAGCLSITIRRASRFWALPSLTARMGHMGATGTVRKGGSANWGKGGKQETFCQTLQPDSSQSTEMKISAIGSWQILISRGRVSMR